VHSFDVSAGPQHLQEQQRQQLQEPGPAQQQQEQANSAKQSKYESLDFELIENTVYRTDAAARTHLDHIMEGGVKWSICFALGKAAWLTGGVSDRTKQHQSHVQDSAAYMLCT
jgi:coproporphyrinogen III oxidase-like Fe-S oxidoreductase